MTLNYHSLCAIRSPLMLFPRESPSAQPLKPHKVGSAFASSRPAPGSHPSVMPMPLQEPGTPREFDARNKVALAGTLSKLLTSR